MDFQKIVDSFSTPCAVFSIEKSEDNYCKEMRIVKSNELYKTTMGKDRVYDNMLYQELVPREVKFETFCYDAAVNKRNKHTYVRSPAVNGWTESIVLPLNFQEGNIYYCLFFFEVTKSADSEKMADISIETASLVIKDYIKLRSTDNFTESINSVVADIQEKTQAFCCAIVILNSKKREYTVLAEKFEDNFTKILDFDRYLTYDVISSWEKTMEDSNGIIIKDENDFKDLEEKNSFWTKSLHDSGVRNVILYPLLQERKTFGYLFITNFNTNNLLEKKEFIELTSFFLSAEIANHLLINQLQVLSSTDLLTGVKNRNSMNNYVNQFVNDEKKSTCPFGVMFADVNGLKNENDNKGHESGDILLKKTAVLLKEVFSSAEIYRAGGDEFVVICENCTEEFFNSKICELKEKSSFDCEVCLAIGSYWDSKGMDIRKAMHLADEAMYKDKEEFYRLHG